MTDDKLQMALKEVAEWKAKALATQKAAETLRDRAQAIRDRAHQTQETNKDLLASLQKAQEREQSLQKTLAMVEQQLALYVRALEETQRGGGIAEIQAAMQSVLQQPTLQDALQKELEAWQEALQRAEEKNAFLQGEVDFYKAQAALLATLQKELDSTQLALQASEEKNAPLQSEVEWYQDQASNLMKELSLKDEVLEDKEREYFSLYGELDLTKSLVKEMGQAVEGSESLLNKQRREHQSSLDLLAQRERDLIAKSNELEVMEADTQRLVEEFHQEAESLRGEIVLLTEEKLALEQQLEQSATAGQELERMKWFVDLLEDQRSDLEIVNSELQQRLAELEG